jgi:hypothetical protein
MRQKNGFDQFPRFKSKGNEFEEGDKYLLRQFTGLLIHQNPLRDNIMEVNYFYRKKKKSKD